MAQFLDVHGLLTLWNKIKNKLATSKLVTTSIGSASTGSAISADDITAWDPGSASQLPSLTITSTGVATGALASNGSGATIATGISTSNGTATYASYNSGVFKITTGSAPITSVTATTSKLAVANIGSASGWSAGAVSTPPSLSYESRSIPNISVSSVTVATGTLSASGSGSVVATGF